MTQTPPWSLGSPNSQAGRLHKTSACNRPWGQMVLAHPPNLWRETRCFCFRSFFLPAVSLVFPPNFLGKHRIGPVD